MVVNPCLEPPDGATGRQPLYRLGDAGMVLLVHQAGVGLMEELDLVIAKLVLKGGVDLQESALKADAAEQVGREGKELILPTGSRQQQGAQSSKQRADHGRPVTVVMGDQAWPDNGHPIRKGSHKQRSKIGESIVARCLSRLKSGTGGGRRTAGKKKRRAHSDAVGPRNSWRARQDSNLRPSASETNHENVENAPLVAECSKNNLKISGLQTSKA